MELDAQNSIPGKVFDYFQAVSDFFNNEEYEANIPAMPYLHEGLNDHVKR